MYIKYKTALYLKEQLPVGGERVSQFCSGRQIHRLVHDLPAEEQISSNF